MASAKLMDDVELAERLSVWMRSHVPNSSGAVKVEPFSGGHSNPTYKVTTPAALFVLRCKPWGHLLHSAHAVDREFRVLQALHPTGFPVPRPYGYCDDDAIIGTPFYVMEMLQGRIFRNPALPGAEKQERRPLYVEMTRTLARLHSLDPQTLGLSDFAPPGNYMDRQLKRWTKQYRASKTVSIPAMERLIAWLPTTLPQQNRTTVVHGDFKVDNMIFAPAAAKVAGLLDWELSTLGEPICDLTYFAMTWINGALGADGDLGSAGYPNLDEMMQLYCEETGWSDLPQFDWYLSYNYFRLSAILQGIAARARDGTANAPDAEAMALRVQPMADLAWSFAERAGATF